MKGLRGLISGFGVGGKQPGESGQATAAFVVGDGARKGLARTDEDHHLLTARQRRVHQRASEHHSLAFVNGNYHKWIFRPLRTMDRDGVPVRQVRERRLVIDDPSRAKTDGDFVFRHFLNAARFAVADAQLVIVPRMQYAVARQKDLLR